jgi:endonuclease/exonuclease/phosphatase family metal-dependent hydrolase
MRRGVTTVALAAALALVACQGDRLTGPDASAGLAAAGSSADAAATGDIVVMTWNVYVGASIEAALDVPSPDQIPFAVAGVWGEIQASDFPARAGRIADEIAKYRPHLVGLQEINKFYLQTPSDFDPATFDPGIPATNLVLDYEAEILAALAERGLDYDVAVRTDNFTLEFPMVDPGSPTFLSDIRLQDHDLLLVRSDVPWENGYTQDFSLNLDYTEILGVPIVTDRGFGFVDTEVAGLPFRFVVTHLEPADILPGNVVHPDVEALQRAQAMELRGVVAGERPVIVVGDLNSDAYGSSTQTYFDFLDAGYVDAHNQSGGWTCCQDGGLEAWPSEMDRRVDLVMLNGDFGFDRPLSGAVQTLIVGSSRSDWTDDGLLPSDHAGVVATLRLK